MKHSFSLVPFAADKAPAISIAGEIQRQGDRLKIFYCLEGASQIIIPEITYNPTRQYDLWNHTCFEFFLRIHNSTKYWEFNLSPAGHWNVFRFPDYRQDIAEEMALAFLPFKVQMQADLLQLDLEVNLKKIISPQQKLEASVTTVIEDRASRLSYWALSHSGKEPDFHHQDSFLIDLSL